MTSLTGAGNAPMATGTADPRRNKDLSRIHIMKKELGLDDDCYRALLQGATGKSSAKDMDYKERWRVICEMGRLLNGGKKQAGAPQGRFPGEPPGWAEAKAHLGGKIKALLADAKRPWSYAHAMAKRMYGIDCVQFCTPDQLWRIVAALERDKQRRVAKAAKVRAEA